MFAGRGELGGPTSFFRLGAVVSQSLCRVWFLQVIYAENADVVATRVTFRNSTAVGLGGVMYGLNANLTATDVVADDVRSDVRSSRLDGGLGVLMARVVGRNHRVATCCSLDIAHNLFRPRIARTAVDLPT